MGDFIQTGSKGLSEPPAGVLAGENVPVENQMTQFEEQMIDEACGVMKSKGLPYTNMSESELREKAIEVLDL